MRSQSHFAQIPSAQIQRSRFDRSHTVKTAFDAGYLVPVFVDEALPGDTFSLHASSFVRMSTPLFPLMDNLYLDYFFFAVPVRLIWDDWQKFNGEQKNPGDSTDFLTPQVTGPVVEGGLSDYFGLPLIATDISVNAFHHRAYNLIFNEWFRDQNLVDSVPVHTGAGPDPIADYVLLKRGKRHDYFTSCLPFPQKGEAVDMPIGDQAPVVSTGSNIPTFGFPSNYPVPYTLTGGNSNTGVAWSSAPADPNGTPASWVTTSLAADLSAATSATINQLREAFQIQRLLERDARGGSRYTEIVRAHFGVVSPDARLQRPEYLGGGVTRVNIHPVAATISGATPIETSLGDLGAFAVSSGSGIGFVKSFTEHCVLLGLVCARADLNYQQGINRMWSRRTRFDFYWPSLAHLGEQPVLNREIYATGVGDPALSTGDYATFGFQERYAEYRYKPSVICGAMRSTSATPLDQWHLAQEFTALPVLNDVFIQENPPMDRILAVAGNAPDFFGDFYFKMSCARPMPVYSVPGLIDHF